MKIALAFDDIQDVAIGLAKLAGNNLKQSYEKYFSFITNRGSAAKIDALTEALL